MLKNKVYLLPVLLCSWLSFYAQNNTNSPYTRYGYGDVIDVHTAEQKAMGGVALGARSKQSINVINPASYSNVDTLTFMFDLGISGLYSSFRNNNGSNDKFTANLDYITMQFPIFKNIGFSAGLLPYSFVGYDYSETGHTLTKVADDNFDTVYYTKSFVGSGGFNQVYLGLSAKLFKHVSIGANAYYLFGDILHSKNMTLTNFNDLSYEIDTLRARTIRFRYGVQYFNTFNQKHDITFGLVFENKTRLRGSFSKATVKFDNDIAAGNLKDSIYELPLMIGAGVYYTYNKQWSFGLDYSLQQWSNSKYCGFYSFNNKSRLALGGEYLPNYKSRKFVQRLRYRAGLNMTTTYYNVNNTALPTNFSATVGVGIPIVSNTYKSTNMLNTSVEYGKIGNMDQLRENYFKITLSLCFDEHWFFKRKL